MIVRCYNLIWCLFASCASKPYYFYGVEWKVSVYFGTVSIWHHHNSQIGLTDGRIHFLYPESDSCTNLRKLLSLISFLRWVGFGLTTSNICSQLQEGMRKEEWKKGLQISQGCVESHNKDFTEHVGQLLMLNRYKHDLYMVQTHTVSCTSKYKSSAPLLSLRGMVTSNHRLLLWWVNTIR